MTGLVTTVDRGRYTCAIDAGASSASVCSKTVTAMRARELGRRGVVVGDRVSLVGDLSGHPDSLARIVRVAERTGTLRRSADDGDVAERVVVANADQLVIVSSLADPPPRTGLIDRCLVAAEDAGIKPLLVFTKSDLAPPDDVLAYYRNVEVEYVVWHRGQAVDPITTHVSRPQGTFTTISVLVGHSGVGKSTVVNALIPSAHRATGRVSAVGKGRHTSTSVQALPLPLGGWVIDTPGIRSFGLGHIPAVDLIHGYTDLLEGSLQCEGGCDHSRRQPSCALDDWCKRGNAPAERLASYRALLSSLQR